MPYADPNSERAKASRRRNALKYYQKTRDKQIQKASNWNKNNRKRVNENSVNRRSKKLSPQMVLFNNAKNRAKAFGIPFELTIDDIVIPEVCPILGIVLKVNTGHAKDDSISIDRIIPSKGYIKGNIQVMSHKANTIKSNATLEELRKVVEWLNSNREEHQEVSA